MLDVFFDERGHDLRHGAVFLLKNHRSFTLVLNVEMLIVDIEALCEAIAAAGVSDTLPCLSRRRILSWRALNNSAIAKHCADFCKLGCLDQRKWGKHTDASLRRTLTDIATVAAAGSPDELVEKQTLNGYKHLPNSFLLNPPTIMCPAQAILMDWMHLFFQSCNWNREVYAVLAAATSRATYAYNMIWKCVKLFTLPEAVDSAVSLLSAGHWESCKAAKPQCLRALHLMVCRFTL